MNLGVRPNSFSYQIFIEYPVCVALFWAFGEYNNNLYRHKPAPELTSKWEWERERIGKRSTGKLHRLSQMMSSGRNINQTGLGNLMEAILNSMTYQDSKTGGMNSYWREVKPKERDKREPEVLR